MEARTRVVAFPSMRCNYALRDSTFWSPNWTGFSILLRLLRRS